MKTNPIKPKRQIKLQTQYLGSVRPPGANFSPAFFETSGGVSTILLSVTMKSHRQQVEEEGGRSIQNTWNVDLSGRFLCIEGILPCKPGVHTQPKKTTNSYEAQSSPSTIKHINPGERINLLKDVKLWSWARNMCCHFKLKGPYQTDIKFSHFPFGRGVKFSSLGVHYLTKDFRLTPASLK